MDDERQDIWLVNDDSIQLKIQKRLLGKLATCVTEFQSPVQAIALARQGKSSPYLVTDLNMPEMSGAELAQFWCQLHPKARVLLLSASSASKNELDKIEKLPQGSVRLLTSYRIPQLQELVAGWLLAKKISEKPALGFKNAPASGLENAQNIAYLDLPTLRKLVSLGGKAFASEIVERFLESCQNKVEGILSAFSQNDLKAVHGLSHALKGSCGLVGAVYLYQIADSLESLTSLDKLSEPLSEKMLELEKVSKLTLREIKNSEL